MRPLPFAVLALFLASSSPLGAQRPPVIDVHLHAYDGALSGVGPAWAAEAVRDLEGAPDSEAHLQATLEVMDRYNVVLAVVSGPEAAVRRWQEEAPGRFLGGAFLGPGGEPEHTPSELGRLQEEGVMHVLGELGLQYEGISPADPAMEPYWSFAEEAGMPVALHTGLGPPGGPHTFAPRFRTTLGRPSLVEPVLVRHPELDMYLMHAGWPYIEETIAMMYIYPDLYVDVGVLAWAIPEAAFHAALRRLVDAEFDDRILFGTDQMQWPGAVGVAIEAIESVPFLSEAQKRAILYDSAARFLGLSDEEIAAHHGGTGAGRGR